MATSALVGQAIVGQTNVGVIAQEPSEPTPLGFQVRFRAYAPNGTSLGYLPKVGRFACAFGQAERGALEFDYDAQAPLANLLSGDVEIAVEIRQGEENWVEPKDGRFLVLGRDGEKKTSTLTTYTGHPYMFRLMKAYVDANGVVTAEGRRKFAAATPGAILSALVNEAQGRGALAGITATSFNGATDSAGKAWSNLLNIEYELGIDLLTVAAQLIDQGVISVHFDGRTMHVYDGDAGVDKSSTVTLLNGRDIFEAPERSDLTRLADAAFVKGDGGKYAEVTKPAQQGAWGRFETTVNQGGVSDTDTLNYLGVAALERSGKAKREATRGVVFQQGSPVPMVDYSPGDWISDMLSGTSEKLRVYQVSLFRDVETDPIKGSLILNDRLAELETALVRRVNGVVGGSTVGGGSGATPISPTAPPPADTTVPKPPTGLTYTSDAYIDSDGRARSGILFSWTAPTQNTDNTTITDFKDFAFWWRKVGDTDWRSIGVVETTYFVANLDPGASYEWRIRTWDWNNHRSDWAGPFVAIAAKDATPPPPPSQPTAVVKLGVVTIGCDAKDNTGATMPADLSYFEVHRSTASNFTPSASTLVGTLPRVGGTLAFSGQAYNAANYYRLVAVDSSGNKSAPSVQVAATTAPLVGSDLAQKIINDTLVADGAIKAPALAAGAVVASKMAVGDLSNMAQINETEVGAVTYGGWTSTIYEAATGKRWSMRDKLTANGYFMFRNKSGPIPFKAGDRIRVTLQAYSATASIDVPSLGFWAYDPLGANLNWSLTKVEGPAQITSLGNDFAWEGVVPASFDTRNAVDFLFGFSSSLGANDTRVRNVRAYVMNAGELVVDGSIKTNHLAANSITVDHLQAGFFQGLIVEGATIRTAATGARTVLRPGASSIGYGNGVLEMWAGKGEVAPAEIYSISDGAASSDNLSLYLMSPKKLSNSSRSFIQLFSSDADHAGSAYMRSATGGSASIRGDASAYIAAGPSTAINHMKVFQDSTAEITLDNAWYLRFMDQSILAYKPIKAGVSGEWQAVTLGNGWVNYGGSHPPASYRALPDGRVELRGVIRNGLTNGAQIFNMNSNCMPAYTHIFYAPAGAGFARIDIHPTNGVMFHSVVAGGTNGSVSLSGITFPAGG